MAPNQGAGTAYKIIKISYLQDCNVSPCITVRDAGIKQITYGYSTSGTSSIDTLVGTVDFSYAALPYTSATCSDGSSTNNGGLRCDDPYGDNVYILDPPAVMSTLTLQSVTSYVGSDTSGSKAYGYSFSYQDSAPSSDIEPISGVEEIIAGEHLLTKIEIIKILLVQLIIPILAMATIARSILLARLWCSGIEAILQKVRIAMVPN